MPTLSMMKTGFALTFMAGLAVASTMITQQTAASISDPSFPLLSLANGRGVPRSLEIPAPAPATSGGTETSTDGGELDGGASQFTSLTDAPSLLATTLSEDGRGEPRPTMSPADPGGRGVPRPGQ